MNDEKKKEDQNTPAIDPNKQPLPPIEGETVVESDLDDVAGGAMGFCFTSCGLVTV